MRLLLTLALSLAAASLARAQNADEMARQVANPIASLTASRRRVLPRGAAGCA